MNVLELRAAFSAGKIAKPVYIDRMSERHRLLHDYAELLADTEISRIEIEGGRVAMTTRDGVKLFCKRDDKRIAPLETLNFGSIEPAETAMTTRLLKGARTVLDVGANIGWWSMTMARRHPKARFHAFEPIPSTFASLREHLKINACRTIEAHNLAFSDGRGKKRFYFYPEGSVNASAANLTKGKTVRAVSCRAERLDDFVRRKKLRVDFIKCDVEGGELFVFKGALDTLKRDRPIVFSEMLRKWSAAFGYHPNEIIALFAGFGYRCWFVKKGKLAELKKMTDSTRETNFFFVHPSRRHLG